MEGSGSGNCGVVVGAAQDFKPAVIYWRILLIIRKLLMVIVTLFFIHNPLFQSSLCILM